MSEYGSLYEPAEEWYPELRERVQERLGLEKEGSDIQVKRQIYEVLSAESHKKYIPVQKRVQMGRRLFNSLRRLDILQPMLEDPEVTEIMVNGPEHIYVERQGRLYRARARFESQQRLEDVIQQIVGQVNRRVNELVPIADARLADGSRINVILPPIALNGPILTIRKFRSQPITLREMIQWGTLTEEAAAFLQKLVRNRYNLFVCGGTGAGKTTLLNVLGNLIPEGERIITIEDAAELRLSALDNVVTLEARGGGIDGKGAVTIRDLIKTSLRARPDRIIVGEVRGAEALDMLSAMNTGHEGSLSTGHANSTEDMLSRIETMVLMGAELPVEAIRQQIASALDIFIYISRGGGMRRITQIQQVLGMENGKVQLQPLFELQNGKLCRTTAPLYRKKGEMR